MTADIERESSLGAIQLFNESKSPYYNKNDLANGLIDLGLICDEIL